MNLFAMQDPFRGGDNILVLCETCLPVTGEPIPSNSRAKARAAFDAAPGLEPWFGIEQEYTLFDKDMVGATSDLNRAWCIVSRTITTCPRAHRRRGLGHSRKEEQDDKYSVPKWSSFALWAPRLEGWSPNDTSAPLRAVAISASALEM